MTLLKRAFARVKGVFRTRKHDPAFDEELQSHIELATDDFIRRGMHPQQARRAALLELGGVEKAREARHDQGTLPILETTLQDVRIGLRMLAKTPRFTIVAVLTLALGIGANVLMFSVIDTVMIRPLPFADPERLVMIFSAFPQRNISRGLVSFPLYEELERSSKSFQSIAHYRYWSFDLTDDRYAEAITAAKVSHSFFDTLQPKFQHGRPFRPAEQGVAVLADSVWREHFGADSALLGQTIRLDGDPYTLIGVLQPGTELPLDVRIWVPDVLSSEDRANPGGNTFVLARLQPNTDSGTAQAELAVIANRLRERMPAASAGMELKAFDLRASIVGDRRIVLLALGAAVGFVLLIAGANLANMLLAAAVARRRDVAVRYALGSTRARMLRQLLTENLLLAGIGGAVALLLAKWGLEGIKALGHELVPRLEGAAIDLRVLAFTAALTVVTALLFGSLPAWSLSTAKPNDALKESSASITRGRHKLRAGLVVAQVALVLALLNGAALMIQSLMRLRSVDPGFQANNLLSLQLFLATRRYGSDDAEDRFYRELLPRLSAMRGVARAAMAAPVPFGPVQQTWSTTFTIPGEPPPAPGQEPLAFRARVSPEYFRTMGIPLLRGRYFEEAEDRVGAKKVTIVSDKLARTFFPDGNAIGRQINTGPKSGIFEIVGVVGDVIHRSLDSQLLPEIYIPLGQAPSGNIVVLLRTTDSPMSVADDLRALVWSIDPWLPATYLQPVDEVITESMAERRLNTLILGGFTALAFSLALVGIYGVISYIVSEGTREIGLRMALGAMPGDVFRQVLGRGLVLTAAGIAVGALVSIAGARFLQALLFQTSPTEPLVIAASVAAMLAAATAACYLPARRATRVDPMLALRYE